MIIWLVSILAWAALGIFPFLFLGWRFISIDPTISPTEGYIEAYGWIVFSVGTLAVILNVWLLRRRGKEHVYATILAVTLSLTTIYGVEAVARFFAPGWPARGLHAVSQFVAESGWARAINRPGAIGINSWGQRDRDRQKRPSDGLRRLVFIGDSYLEESVLVPVSLAVEEKLSDQGFETVNLGVSASAPDEYFWRLKNIGLDLEPSRILVFIYAGNDWQISPSLPTFHGISAPYPRDSAMEAIGLGAINHFIMWKRRPLMRAWGEARELLEQENAILKEFKQTPDEGMPRLLSKYFPSEKRLGVQNFLSGLDLKEFYNGLRNPDAGLFRSYYLLAALRHLGFADKLNMQVNKQAIDYVYGLLAAMQAYCQEQGVDFTVVLVPEASQVDPRFRAFWGQISYLHLGRYNEKISSDRLKERAKKAGMDVLDLHESFKEIPGTYLNLDGHWTEKGVQTAAGAIAAYFRDSSHGGSRISQ